MDRLLEATARAERDHFWFRGFRRFIEPLVADAAGDRRPEILDCGCGTGHNLHMLRRYGRAYGIDLTWAGLQYARATGGASRSRARPSAAAPLRRRPLRSGDLVRRDLCAPDEVERNGDRRRCSACCSPADG